MAEIRVTNCPWNNCYCKRLKLLQEKKMVSAEMVGKAVNTPVVGETIKVNHPNGSVGKIESLSQVRYCVYVKFEYGKTKEGLPVSATANVNIFDLIYCSQAQYDFCVNREFNSGQVYQGADVV